MKLIRRLTTVVMILSLLALPMASLAEGVRSFSIGNISFDALGMAMNIGATADVKIGSKDGRNLITFALLGGATGTDEIGTVYLAADDDELKATLAGLSEAFSVTKEELQQVMAQFASQAGAEAVSQFDTDSLKAVLDSYLKMAESQKDKEKVKKDQAELNEKLIAYLGDRYEDLGEESFEVFGNQYTGKKAKFNMNMADADAVINLMTESDPNAKAFIENYFKLLSSAFAAQGMAPINSLSELYSNAGVDFSFDIVTLSDEATGAGLIDYVFHTTIDETTMDMPMKMQVLSNDEGEKVNVLIDTVIDEVPMYMNIDINETADGAGDFTYVMNAGPEDEKVDMNMYMAMTNAEGKETFNFTMDMAVNGEQAFACETGYDGTVTKLEPGKAHAGKISAKADIPNFGTVSFAADVKYSNEPKAEVDFSVIDALPTTSVTALDEEKMQAVTSEAEVIAIKALGVLMQTPGVAEIVSMAMASAQAQSPADSSAYGYEDYSADSEDIEDFESWEEIEGEDADVPA